MEVYERKASVVVRGLYLQSPTPTQMYQSGEAGYRRQHIYFYPIPKSSDSSIHYQPLQTITSST
jgi:hypothetical protein